MARSSSASAMLSWPSAVTTSAAASSVRCLITKLAAAILSVGNWPWLFAVNVPFGVAALVIGWGSLPLSPLGKHDFDWISALLSALTFGLLIGSIDLLGHGEAFPLFLLEMLATFGIGYWLVKRQLAQLERKGA